MLLSVAHLSTIAFDTLFSALDVAGEPGSQPQVQSLLGALEIRHQELSGQELIFAQVLHFLLLSIFLLSFVL